MSRFRISHTFFYTGGPTTFNGCASVLKTKPFVLPLPATWKTLSYYAQSARVFCRLFFRDEKRLTGACIKYEYFNTSANKKLSCTLRNDPPFAALTSEMAEKPRPVLVVALIARNASHAQSWYIVLPWVRMSARRSRAECRDV